MYITFMSVVRICGIFGKRIFLYFSDRPNRSQSAPQTTIFAEGNNLTVVVNIIILSLFYY